MAIDWGRVAMGVGTGGQSELWRGGLSAAGGLFGKKKTASQQPFLTDQQLSAQKLLDAFAHTGRFGNFEAGAEVPLGYGDFNATGYEQQGLSTLGDLLRNGIPEQYRMGDEALRDMLSTDPSKIQAQFEPFKAQTERQLRDSQDALKRSAGFSGNLYSTGTIRNLGDIQARGNETLSSQLAELTNQAMNRRLQAIPLAYQSAQAQQQDALSRVAASQEFGSLTRRLNDESIRRRDAEMLRRRSELQLPIQAATSLGGMNAQFGVPSVEQSPYQDLLRMLGQLGGSYLGGKAFAAGAA